MKEEGRRKKKKDNGFEFFKIDIFNKTNKLFIHENKWRKVYLRDHELKASIFHVPAEFWNGPTSTTKGMCIGNNILKIHFVVSGLVQPRGSPQQLIHISTHRRIVVLYHFDTSIIISPILVSELKQLQNTYNKCFHSHNTSLKILINV